MKINRAMGGQHVEKTGHPQAENLEKFSCTHNLSQPLAKLATFATFAGPPDLLSRQARRGSLLRFWNLGTARHRHVHRGARLGRGRWTLACDRRVENRFLVTT